MPNGTALYSRQEVLCSPRTGGGSDTPLRLHIPNERARLGNTETIEAPPTPTPRPPSHPLLQRIHNEIPAGSTIDTA